MRKVINYYMRVNGSQHIVEHIGNHESGDLLIGQLFETSGNGYRAHPFDFHKEYQKIDKSVVDALERQTCPERTGGLHAFSKEEGVDHWKRLPNGDKVCSYCGSLHPDTLLQLLKEGKASINPSTKNYKWYVDRANVKNAMEGGIKYYKWHNTPEFVAAFNALYSK